MHRFLMQGIFSFQGKMSLISEIFSIRNKQFKIQAIKY